VTDERPVTPDQRLALEELARRKIMREAIMRELHDKQRMVLQWLLLGVTQFVAALCGRRSGKTEMDARIIAVALEMCGHDEWVIYAARTRGLAKDLIWARLEALNERHGFGWRMLENEGLIETKRGGKFRVFGFDKLPELEKTRGYKIRCAIFDEPSTYADRLEALIRDCVGPALSDLRGWLIINGTPGAVCVGFWYEASTGLRKRYKIARWSVRENPRYPRDAEEMLLEERTENEWDEENATYQREWLATWVNDPTAQVYKYVDDRNGIDELPDGYAERGEGWTFSLGVDWGYSPDPCAWVVLGSPRNSRVTYVVHDEQHHELLPDEAAAVTARLVERFDPAVVVGDPAGKDYIAEWNRRHAEKSKAWMMPADKLGKVDAIEVVNGELRSKRWMVYRKGAPNWVHEGQHLPWKNERREEEHPSYPQHSLDAALYASRAHRAYLHSVPSAAPTPNEAERLAQLERIRRVQEARARAREDEDNW
jgi:hypothetical protein